MNARDLKPNMLDYDETYKNFRWNVPEFYNFGLDVVDSWAKKKPEKLALLAIDTDGETTRKISFKELSKESSKFANVLKEIGVKKGDRIFIMVPRIPEWYYAMIGMIKIGAIPMPTTVMATPKDIEFRLNRSDAVMAITDYENSQKVDEVKDKCPTLKKILVLGGKRNNWVSYEEHMKKASETLNVEKTKSSDPLMIYFTSGTESYPKMVIHIQAYAIGHLVTAKFCQDLKESDVHWTIADTGWAKTAWGKLFGQWIVGATIVQFNIKDKFSAADALDTIQKFKVTTFCAPPTIYRMMILEDLSKWDFKNLRHCMSAGEPLNPEVINTWKEHTGLHIYDFYGQTESVALVSNYRCLEVRPGSMGKPTPGHIVEIVDDEGKILPPGEEGNICVKVKPEWPPGIFREYWKDDEKTAKCFRGNWYYTGDRAYKDKDGYIWFVGRADDVIKASGYRISPFEVESVLIEHPAVAEAAVVGAPDDVRGIVIKAYVILAPGHKPSDELRKDIQDFVKRTTAPYKYPRILEFVDKLPKTISGKIRRVELRKMSEKK